MDAMLYEILIRQANECGRHGVHGANADLYRHFEMAVSLYEDAKKELPKLSSKTDDELCFDAAFNMGIITAHIKSAIYKVMRDKEGLLSEEQYQKLEDNLVYLVRPSKQKIDKVIESSSNIFREVGLLAQ